MWPRGNREPLFGAWSHSAVGGVQLFTTSGLEDPAPACSASPPCTCLGAGRLVGAFRICSSQDGLGGSSAPDTRRTGPLEGSELRPAF